MKVTRGWKEFSEACLDTPIGAVAVKKRGKSFDELVDDDYGHGVLVDPRVTVGMINGPDELAGIMNYRWPNKLVTVRGHGWGHEVPFVWTGTTKEFNETWVID